MIIVETDNKFTEKAIADKVGGCIHFTVYTDPLCCWSWAFEPQLQQLKKMLGGKATWDYKMGGLIADWNNFRDNDNAVTRPSQMGPVWMHAGQVANLDIQYKLWNNDPPASSYPACIAVKCAQLQSSHLGEIMLHQLRKAAMEQGKNIARPAVLDEIAFAVSKLDYSFDFARYQADYTNGNGVESFRADLKSVSYYNINRFPSLVARSTAGKGWLFSGYRDHIDIINQLQQ